jgi:plasmid stabilization system protein ParE
MRKKFEKRIAVLNTIPTAGRARPGLGDRIRSLPAGSHIVFFKIVDSYVLILSIRHARRRDPRSEDLD